MDELLRQNMSELVALLTSMLQNGLDKMPTLFEQMLDYSRYNAHALIWLGVALIVLGIVAVILDGIAGSGDLVSVGIFIVVLGIVMIVSYARVLYSINHTPQFFIFTKIMKYL